MKTNVVTKRTRTASLQVLTNTHAQTAPKMKMTTDIPAAITNAHGISCDKIDKNISCPGGLPQEGATALGCMIYRSYVSWCKENGFFALNSRRFYAEFRKRFPQFWETPSKGGAVFHGVG